MRKILSAAVCAAAIVTAGCASHVGESHYFATVDPANNQPVNYFRVTVKGGSGLANGRYVSGWYDERAVDLFLNESKSKPLTAADYQSGVPPIFKLPDCANLDGAACSAAKEKQLKLSPVGEDVSQNGAFVLILSTNADAISNTIGSIAESETVINSALFLLNRDQVVEAAKLQATKPVADARRTATMTELTNVLAQAKSATSTEELQSAYLAVLRAAAAGLNGTPVTFSDENEARAWFQAEGAKR